MIMKRETSARVKKCCLFLLRNQIFFQVGRSDDYEKKYFSHKSPCKVIFNNEKSIK